MAVNAPLCTWPIEAAPFEKKNFTGAEVPRRASRIWY
jgi:hypothetical protein